jgi:hypothetical protein
MHACSFSILLLVRGRLDPVSDKHRNSNRASPYSAAIFAVMAKHRRASTRKAAQARW